MTNSVPADADLPTFNELGLAPAVETAVSELGYERPSAIQAATIPLLLQGRDVLGQAQTGTGKTAAFALPLLSLLDTSSRQTQALVLAPTRELAIQVAEAIQSYAKHIGGLKVMSIYGGQGYREQLDGLKRGVQVVVGTPGRVMDHIRRGTLKLEGLKHLVLDEADEMLRMGFIDDVEWILAQTPSTRQIALFSATMPAPVRRIANTYLNDPEHVTIKTKTTTAVSIRQRFWLARGASKFDALCRILEAEPYDGMIVFVRTKLASNELAEKLQARGFAAAELHGDIAQAQRERTVELLKSSRLDILVATDVVARGLDVDRISHVINYDIPYDTEAYVHRIGRTGRAGRSGDAILFVAPRERRMLQAIERATRQGIEEMALPGTAEINELRTKRFLEKFQASLDAGRERELYRDLLEGYCSKHEIDLLDAAAALARLAQGDKDLHLTKELSATKISPARREPSERKDSRDGARRPPRGAGPEGGMERFRVEVGRKHGVGVGNIVGAIANEGGIDSESIGRIQLFDDFSTVDLPAQMPDEVVKALQAPRVAGQMLNMSRFSGELPEIPRRKPRKTAGDEKKRHRKGDKDKLVSKRKITKTSSPKTS
ncbi:DEAD/DEAH box helicase [Spongiibacter sp. KMU-166]|uniref:ATP-dependent RNA helicase DeaD n=1 Tax=Spongiibacter thalassae TaxID=2721624 RepID=A0ABX1GAT9_9GAMM|nr:DEAD/DEAH box helicase [Spongiibacter thalassae]NKI16279.1 DEAD/DEAH box helicase [Spongiibacter thalassae]